MKPQEANKLIAEFMGMGCSNEEYYPRPVRIALSCVALYNSGSWINEDELLFHESWDWLMPVITKLKSIDPDWINEEAQHIIDDIDDALTCCWGFDEVYRYTVDGILNYNEYKS